MNSPLEFGYEGTERIIYWGHKTKIGKLMMRTGMK